MTATVEAPPADQEVDAQGADTPEREPVDLLSVLTIDELNDGSRLLKASLIMAVTEQTQHYERALAVLAYLHARRADPGAKLAPFMALTFTQLGDRLGAFAESYGAADPLALGR